MGLVSGVLRAIPTSPTHVLIVPVNGNVLDWMAQGMNSIWSQVLSDIVFEVG